MQSSVQIVWFKRDLRLHDHRPLVDAAARGPVLPLYIVEPDYWTLKDSSRRHWQFIHDSLGDVQEALNARGAHLILRVGRAVDVLEDLRQSLQQFTLWSHEETGNDWTFTRDKEVLAWCKAHQIEWHETSSNGVVRRLKSRNGWSALRDARMAEPVVSAPLRLTMVDGIGGEPRPSKDHPMFGASVGQVQQGGRKEALSTLASFLQQRASKYMLTISKPGISARHCSRLSAHLAFGTLSVREVEQATKARMAELAQHGDEPAKHLRKNLGAFLSRLAWRCHFVQKLEQRPDLEFRCMHPAFEGMREPHFRQDYFDAWATGRTGYPLVDAAMRSLHANGWITFRMRAMLVSFASYHLWLDWRQTAPFMAQLFTDYEPGIHISQFQMQSGVTGINAVRMYNPVKQSIDHDPNGQFIRRYVPELQNVSAQWIHEPWRMPEPCPAYPQPVVDHDSALRQARARIGAYRQQPDFREEAKAVHNRLGSRMKQTRTAPRKPKSKDQLSFDL